MILLTEFGYILLASCCCFPNRFIGGVWSFNFIYFITEFNKHFIIQIRFDFKSIECFRQSEKYVRYETNGIEVKRNQNNLTDWSKPVENIL